MATRKFHRQTGVTLIEILFTLVILGILTSAALPSFRTMMQSTQARSARDSLMSSLNLARSSALTSSNHVVLCPSEDSQTCSGKTWWQSGWIVFQDSNADNQRNNNEPLIATNQQQPAGQAIMSTEGRTHVTYRPDGSASGTNVTISFCDARGAALASAIIVNNAGRPRTGKPSATQAADACAAI